jgi:hypothetical protein
VPTWIWISKNDLRAKSVIFSKKPLGLVPPVSESLHIASRLLNLGPGFCGGGGACWMNIEPKTTTEAISIVRTINMTRRNNSITRS